MTDVQNIAYGNVQSGERQGSATAVQLPDIAGRLFLISASNHNASDVYLGGSGVTVPDDTTDTTSGLELEPGDTVMLPILNLNVLYMICDAAGDTITYLALS